MSLQKGTRVVLRVAVPGARDVRPEGTVAEIVGSPGEGSLDWRVRFLDGHEATVARAEFELLAEVKAEAPGHAPAQHTTEALRGRIIYRVVIGSRAYGLETEASDTDWRGIYQAPTDLVLSLHDAPPQLEDHVAQECYWELKKFLILALKANPNVLEVLYSPLVEIEKPAATALRDIRDAFLSKLVYQTFGGYVLSQFKKMLRSLEEGREPKWKHAMHLIRLLESGIGILETGTLDLETKHRAELLEIKAGAWPWSRVEARKDALQARFEEAYKKTSLPAHPDYDTVDRYLLRARRGEFGSA